MFNFFKKPKPTNKKTTVAKKTAKSPIKKDAAKKTASRKPKKQKKNEFRTHRQNGHPSYIYEKIGDSFNYVGITHAKITSGLKNIPLERNPNPTDKKTAYVRPFSKSEEISNFKKSKKEGWKISKRDKKKVKINVIKK